MSKELMDFGGAIAAIKDGQKVSRVGWNGKGMFIYYVPENSYTTTTGVAKEIAVNGLVPYRAYIALKTTDGSVATWSPSGSDALAKDWHICEIETYKDRLIVERDELSKKIALLHQALLNNVIPEDQQSILNEQVLAMTNYLDILNKRLES